MDFDQRLKKAMERGQRRGDVEAQAARAKSLGTEELKRLHSPLRLQLSEHIEQCVERLSHHFPGFTYETIFGERGWGAACSRDDLRLASGRRDNDYSRLEMTIRPFSELFVVELMAKATIRNKEVFTRNYFEKIEDADPIKFIELVDVWVLEYAELFAASGQ